MQNENSWQVCVWVMVLRWPFRPVDLLLLNTLKILSTVNFDIPLFFFSLIDHVFGYLQIDLSTIWNVFIITEIHKRQFHSFICILHHYTWLYHDIQIIRKMGIILLLWSIHMIKSMNFNFVQAAANIFSYFKTKVQYYI